jgi:hypothetical protein
VTTRDGLRLDFDVPASTDVREPYAAGGQPVPVPNARLERLRGALGADVRCADVRVTSFLRPGRGPHRIAVWARPNDGATGEDVRSAIREAVTGVLPDARPASA